jgi:putative ATPase
VAIEPLASRMRPGTIDDVLGQEKALKPGSPLSRLISAQAGGFSSVLLWGPPGSGKTTLARLIGQRSDAQFIELSAISATVAQVRDVIADAKKSRDLFDKTTVLFLDEIHRFTKSQQDSLLGAVESGSITLVAATTENPSFSVIKPLISRSLVVSLEPLSKEDILKVLKRALEADAELREHEATPEALEYLAEISSGDARRALTILEAATQASTQVDLTAAKTASENVIAYDARGDVHYDTISAFIKSVRGSDADAAIHYLARMISGGEDPRFIARRLMILATEDIGLADPQALVLAEAAAGVVERIGMPEGRIPLAELTIYLALAPKSNRAYLAINAALEDVQEKAVPPIPPPLRSTGAVGYRYPHDDQRGILKQQYASLTRSYYQPSDLGFERVLQERLKLIREILEG